MMASSDAMSAGEWICYAGHKPVGIGPGPYAALADAVRREPGCSTGTLHSTRADADDCERAATALGPGGLNDAEKTWCEALATTELQHGGPLDAAELALAAAELAGATREGLTVRFADKSELQLTPVRRGTGSSYLVAVPNRQAETEPRARY